MFAECTDPLSTLKARLGNTRECIPRNRVEATCGRFQWKTATLANWFHKDQFRTTPHFGLIYQGNFLKQPELALDRRLLGQAHISFMHLQSLGTKCPTRVLGWVAHTLLGKSIHPFFYLGMLQGGGDALGKREEREKNLWKGQPEHKSPSPYSGV